MKPILGILGGFFVIFLLGFILQTMDYVSFNFWAPKYEDTKREVFENSKSFIEGKRQTLSKYRLEYLKSDDELERKALASTIRSQASGLEVSKLDEPELEKFINEILKGNLPEN